MRKSIGRLKFAALIAILLAFLSVFSAEASDSSPPRRSIIVSVFDSKGNALRDLGKENFRIQLNGRPVTVVDAQYTVANRRIVVLMDMSGSMTDPRHSPNWRIAIDTLNDLFAQMPPDVPIAMVTFGGSVREVFDFSQGRTEIPKWLMDWQTRLPKPKDPWGTALRDAILEGLKLLSPPQRGDAIYAITDGGESKSRASEVQMKTELFGSGVRLFACLLSASYIPTQEEREGLASFADLVVDSGGSLLSTQGLGREKTLGFENPYDRGGREQVKAATDVLINHIRGFWTLDLEVPSDSKSNKVKFEVVGDGGRTKKDLWVTYPRVLLGTK